ncbi:MAG TPA: hypothetical protein VK969_06155, partial [Acidimicrobiia bacterium]|nr:hypothetical protein [Acidimicrobiia bacterium]
MHYGTTAFAHAVMEQRRREAAVVTASRPRSRDRLMRLAALVVVTTLLAVLGVSTAQAANPGAADSQHDAADQGPPDTHGTYLPDTGEYLTLLGFHGWST